VIEDRRGGAKRPDANASGGVPTIASADKIGGTARTAPLFARPTTAAACQFMNVPRTSGMRAAACALHVPSMFLTTSRSIIGCVNSGSPFIINALIRIFSDSSRQAGLRARRPWGNAAATMALGQAAGAGPKEPMLVRRVFTRASRNRTQDQKTSSRKKPHGIRALFACARVRRTEYA
jgi:hypothetical protein